MELELGKATVNIVWGIFFHPIGVGWTILDARLELVMGKSRWVRPNR